MMDEDDLFEEGDYDDDYEDDDYHEDEEPYEMVTTAIKNKIQTPTYQHTPGIKSFQPSYYCDAFGLFLMHQLNTMLTGTNFSLGMRDKFGSLGIYPRVNMPCQGGEIRKYKEKNLGDIRAVAHGELSTRSESYKPADLFAAFPSGIPELFGHRINGSGNKSIEAALRFLFSKNSPFIRAFVSPSVVEFTEDEKGNILGFVLKDMGLDPTVLVNLLWVYKDCKNYQAYLDAGMTEKEAILCCMMQGGNVLTCLHATNIYHFPQYIDIHRFMTGDPHDLTGGSFRDGFDYNRKLINELFEDTNDGGFVWYVEMRKRIGKSSGYTTEEFVKALRGMIEDGMKREKSKHSFNPNWEGKKEKYNG